MLGCHNVGAFIAVTMLVAVGSVMAADLKSAQIEHPVMPAPKASGASHSAGMDALLERGMEALLELVPDRNGLRFCGCPNCNQGTQSGQIGWNGIKDPDGVHCRFCGHKYPSEKYPMDKVLKFKNRRGEEVEWRYWEGPGGEPHYFAARARYDRKSYVGKLVLQMADAYLATGNDKYADAGAELLYHISQRYAGWCFVKDLVTGKDGPMPDAKPPYEYWGGIWSRWFYGDAPSHVAYAYDRLYESGAFERLSEEKGVDVKQAIEHDMLQASIEFLRTYKEYYSNMSPGIYRSLILYGRILNEPDYVHDGVNRAVGLLRNQFFFDGIWKEGSAGYHHQTIGGLRSVFSIAKGYSDPPGYTWPQDGTHFDDLDMERDLPFVNKAINSVRALVFPNRRTVAVHDEWAKSSRQPTDKNVPVLLAGMRHARLARKELPHAMQAHLHFSGGHGHQHADNLNIILWAKGRELLSDIGYTHSAWRAWTTRTLSHNTVTVNEEDQYTRGVGGNVTLYSPISDDLQLVEAQALVAYPELATEYRRRLVIVGVSEADAYVVDIFRVAGGRQHDWALHGSADDDQTATLSLALEKVEGTLLGPDAEFRLPTSETDRGKIPEGRSPAYAFPRDLQKAESRDDWSVAFDFADDSDVHLHTTVIGQPETTVYQVMMPSVRRANESDAELDKYWMPGVVVRRTAAEADLTSTFIAVHEPYMEKRFVRSVKALLPPDPDDVTSPVVIEVVHQAGTDYIVSSPVEGGREVSLQVNGKTLHCDGRFGLVRVHNERLTVAYLTDGTFLRYGSFMLECRQKSDAGKILEVLGDEKNGQYALVVDTKLTPGEALAGSYMIVTHGDGTTHGYEIRSVRNEGNRGILQLADDPGFRLNDDGATEFLYYPQNTIEGENQFRINTSAYFQAQE